MPLPQIETRRTTCNRDCPDACSILVDVDRGTGRALRLRGDPEHPVTQGFLCYRTNRFLERQYSPERLTTPLVRRSGELVPASWDEALGLVARELERIKAESGPAAVFHYRSGGSLGLLKPLGDYFWEQWGPVTVQRGDICSGAGEAAQVADFGDCDSNDLMDLEHARTIVLWGKNPYVSSPHILPLLRHAKARGAKLVLVDPAHHRTAELCQLVIQPAPGGDAALAFGVARWLLDADALDPRAKDYCEGWGEYETLLRSRSVDEWAALAQVSPEQVRTFANVYAQGPSAILVGWGMGRRLNGGSIVRAVDALAAASGNMGRKGGGSLFYWRRRKPFDLSFVRGPAAAPRTVLEPLFGREVLAAKDPEIRAVWIECGNPVVMLPESETVARALETRELVVVVDSFLTDTARLAHVVLPTTTLLEDDDILGSYGHHWIGVARPALERPPGVKTDLEVFQALGERLGVRALDGTAREWKQRLLEPLRRESGVTLEQVEAGAVRSPRAKPVLFEGNVFATPSRKARLVSAWTPPPPGDPEYPLRLLSVSTDRAQASQTPAAAQRDPVDATVHPASAGGLANGERGFLCSRIARIPATVRHDPRQRRDVALVPKGGWLSAGRAANALVRACATDLGEGAAYYDEGVRLERA